MTDEQGKTDFASGLGIGSNKQGKSLVEMTLNTSRLITRLTSLLFVYA
jgi:hypothetical protein